MISGIRRFADDSVPIPTSIDNGFHLTRRHATLDGIKMKMDIIIER